MQRNLPDGELIAHAANLKIARAEEHIRELEDRIAAYVATQPLKLIIRDEYANALSRRLVRSERPIPERISLVLGDAIHNLRAALDIAVFSIIGDKAAKPKAVAFPIAKDEDDLGQAITRCQIDYAGPWVRKAIEVSKPYGGGNALLESLHQLDIDDKHKLILPAIRTVALDGAQLADFASPDQVVAGVSWVLEEGVEFQLPISTEGENRRERMARKKARPREYAFRFQPPCDVHFGEGTPVQLKPVRETLPQMVDMVRATCRAIATAHAADLAASSE